MNIVFPENDHSEYYSTHFKFIYDAFVSSGCSVSKKSGLMVNVVNCYVLVDGKKVLFNISDDLRLGIPEQIDPDCHCCFKFHVDPEHSFSHNVVPFSPISFYNWEEYRNLFALTRYKPGQIVMNNQLATGNAVQRRTVVAQMLKHYCRQLDTKITDQKQFWRKLGNCLVSVCVPGYCNNMLDRGQLQAIALGVCTISPRLPEKLPYNKVLIPGEHYVQCADDYHDLKQKIEWCRGHRSELLRIGNNARHFFAEYLINIKLVEWVRQHI